jgi:hypothetical protein
LQSSEPHGSLHAAAISERLAVVLKKKKEKKKKTFQAAFP